MALSTITQPGFIDWLSGVDHKVAVSPSAGKLFRLYIFKIRRIIIFLDHLSILFLQPELFIIQFNRIFCVSNFIGQIYAAENITCLAGNFRSV